MANTQSAKERIRNSARKARYNRLHRSRARTYVKKVRALVAQKQLLAAREEIVKAISALDRAAGKGVIHPNNAARRKSRLVKLLNNAAAKS
ncbi:MAG: 30S ribosomal protein S20 [Candidatus Roseilinea sp.]|uniref:30S ribosomal protein S20 n=1 Tax=Candidatus Roseilinea sp. TaxID=2838777 RepID=UPI00404B9EB2